MITFGVMSRLLTKNPIAIRQLMTETIFQTDEVEERMEFPEENDSSADIEISKNNPTIEVEKLVDKEELIYWGNNEKGVLFLVDNTDSEYFSEEGKDAFLKTLAALKLTLSDVAVINLFQLNFSIADIEKQLQPKTIVYCTGARTNYGTTFNHTFAEESRNVLITYTFEEMLTNNEKKREFWNAIKNINF